MVTLSVNKSKGIEYWVLRWRTPDGKRRGETVGRKDQVSRRIAEKARREKENEFERSPGRATATRAPTLAKFIDTYLAARKSELSPGAIELHRQTGKYLVAYLGEHRQIDKVTRADARTFKAALAGGELMKVSKRPKLLTAATVDLHTRNAKTMFNHAVDDDLVAFNPFDRMKARKAIQKEWRYVSVDDLRKLLEESPSEAWRLLLALARFAGLRRGEALNLRWSNIDWDRRRLRIIASDEWTPKDRDSREVPIGPELHDMLLKAFDSAAEGQVYVIPPEQVNIKNLWRDLRALCKRAGVGEYAKPVHALRKSWAQDMNRRYPANVVAAWGGWSSYETASDHYLTVDDGSYSQATTEKWTQLWTQLGPVKGGNVHKSIAGDGIRTHDVQLGKLAFYH